MFAEILPTFNQFWDLYDKKVGREMCENKWAKISQSDREKIMLHVPEYVESTPNKQYRKNPHSYLNQKSWNDEIVHGKQLTTTAKPIPASQATNNELIAAVAKRYGITANVQNEHGT